MPDENVVLSIVITTFNRKQKVVRLLNSIFDDINNWNNIEIIVIDDFSNDGTKDIINEKFKNKDNLIVIKNKKEELISYSRNIGAKKAKGEYILFIDDDVIIPKNTIPEIYRYGKENDVDCMMPVITYYDKPDIIWCAGISHNFITTLGYLKKKGSFYDPDKLSLDVSDSVLTTFFIKRNIFLEISFDERFFPIGWEDMNFSTELKHIGKQIVVNPSFYVYHDFPEARFIKNKMRLYYEVRNRILFHRRWCKNRIQEIVATSFSIGVAFIYFLLSLNYSTPKAYLKIILMAISDGLLKHPRPYKEIQNKVRQLDKLTKRNTE